MNIVGQIRKEVRQKFFSINGSHDWDHVRRVHSLCVHIGEKEKANLEVLKLAAILHDVGRAQQDSSKGKECHAKIGASLAREMLQRHNIDKKVIDGVVHCIESHRFRSKQKPGTKEAEVLFDADKLDSIGAVGIGRAFLFAGEIGARLHNGEHVDVQKTKAYTKDDTAYREFLVKLRKIKKRMLTEEGKRLAEGRHTYMVHFFSRLQKEICSQM